jgi:hypothetical protein
MNTPRIALSSLVEAMAVRESSAAEPTDVSQSRREHPDSVFMSDAS